MADLTCDLNGCEGRKYCRGFCRKHYARWRRHGSPHGAVSVDPHSVEMDPSRVRELIDQGECPWCQRGPFAFVAVHIRQAHGLSDEDLRRVANLPKSAPTCSPEYSEKKRQEAISRDAAKNLEPMTPEMHRVATQERLKSWDRITSNERDAEIVNHFKTGMLVEEICEEMGLVKSTVRSALRRRGVVDEGEDLRRRAAELTDFSSSERATRGRKRAARVRRSRVQSAVQMWELGATVAAISDARDISMKSVRQMLRREGIEPGDGRSKCSVVAGCARDSGHDGNCFTVAGDDPTAEGDAS